MTHAFEILIRPLVTEKSTFLQEKNNDFVFEVRPDANRFEIRREIERLFPKVKVKKVRVAHCRGKTRRVGKNIGRRSNWKKAFVTLRPGDTIEFFEGV
jgi:large subunit ribosomal protein L23